MYKFTFGMHVSQTNSRFYISFSLYNHLNSYFYTLPRRADTHLVYAVQWSLFHYKSIKK